MEPCEKCDRVENNGGQQMEKRGQKTENGRE
jgi:hypothetical protein